MTIFGADLERSLPILRSCYFIADSADLVRILVMEKSDPTKTVETGNVGIRHPQPMGGLFLARKVNARTGL